MKTKTFSLIGLGLVFALTWPVQQSLGKKPGSEDPPPEPLPELPISYHKAEVAVPVAAAVETNEEGNIIYPYEEYLGGLAFSPSINDNAVVAGAYLKEVHESAGSYHTDAVGCRMVPDSDGNYPIEGIQLLEGNIEWPLPGWPQLWINNRNQIAGTYFYFTGSNYIYHAAIWQQDGDGDGYLDLIDLGVADEGVDSRACALNDEGLVVVWSVALDSAYVLVPEDPDNPITYLICPLPAGDFGLPSAINADGVVLFEKGFVVTPDDIDADGDGNPWVGGNATVDILQPLLEGDWVDANDINNLGQIVGRSGHPSGRYNEISRAVVWENASAVPDDLGGLSDRSTDLVATAINNMGQMIGECIDKKTLTSFLIYEDQMYSFHDLIGLTGSELTGWNISDYSYDLADINDDGWIVSSMGAVCIPEYLDSAP